MGDGWSTYQEVVKTLTQYKGVVEGKMMRHDALKFNNKVFAFYYDHAMGFKLGKEYAIEHHGVKSFEYLNPFKNKPPMKAWYIVSEEEKQHWLELAEQALDVMKASK